jgi:hypothetical protein
MTASHDATSGDWRDAMLARIRTLARGDGPAIAAERKWTPPAHGITGSQSGDATGSCAPATPTTAS